jgi:gamma-D-glutamyl-L-lysine dipeptidyl-peptidase
VLAERGGWAQVVAPWQPCSADPRGYPGWLPAAHLAASPEQSGRFAVVTVPAATLAVETGEPLPAISWASVLPLLARAGDRFLVALPGGRRGRLSADSAGALPTASDPDRLLREARQFLGLPYLWGGTSGLGLDCSGLVHLAFRASGVTVPRDAHDQHAAARPVPLSAARPGDLCFFRRPGEEVHHVGLVTGGDRMLHAPETGGVVEEVPVGGDRLATRCAVGRFA